MFASAALAISKAGLLEEAVAMDIFFESERAPFQPLRRSPLRGSPNADRGAARGARAASASRCSPPAQMSAREAITSTVGTVVIAVRLCPLFVRGATPAKGVPSLPLEANEDSAKHERAPTVCAYSP